ncbi:MAG: diguanylate cyclase domain-containing protein [Bacillota bacterium]
MDYQSITEIYQEIQKTHQEDPECVNLIYSYQVSPDYRDLPKEFNQDLVASKEINLICDKSKLKQELKKEIDRQFRSSGLVSLLIFNFDAVKIKKNKLNYKYWNLLFLRLSEIISQRIRKADILARWSKDVLLIVNPDTRLSAAINLGKRIKSEINKQRFDEIAKIDCRFGVTTLRSGENYRDLLNRVEPAIDLLKEKEEIDLYIFS